MIPDDDKLAANTRGPVDIPVRVAWRFVPPTARNAHVSVVLLFQILQATSALEPSWATLTIVPVPLTNAQKILIGVSSPLKSVEMAVDILSFVPLKFTVARPSVQDVPTFGEVPLPGTVSCNVPKILSHVTTSEPDRTKR
jgi:hypothetical protein